jgi:Right handed beta helix region
MAETYIDPARGKNANPGTFALPWATLDHANNLVAPGDTVWVAPGVYREALTIKANNVAWRAMNRGVEIRGGVATTGWSFVSGTSWSVTLPINAVTPQSVIINDLSIHLSKITYDSQTRLLVVDFGGLNPTSSTVEVGTLPSAFFLNGRTDCLIEGFKVVGMNSHALRVAGGGGHLFRHCEIYGSGGTGVRLASLAVQLFNMATAAGTSTLSAGTYSYVVSAIVGAGETVPSFERSITISAGQVPRVSWSAVAGATSYRIYGRVSGSMQLLYTSAAVEGVDFPLWDDDGSLTPSGGAPPTVNSVPNTSCTVESCETWGGNSHGISLYTFVNSTVRRCLSHHNRLHGIGVQLASNNNLIELNECHSNATISARSAGGIQVDKFGEGTLGSNNNIVQRNWLHDNEDSGLSLYGGSTGSIARWNRCERNGDHGIDVSNAPGAHVVNNLAIDNATAGINAEGASQGVRIFNNLSVDNGIVGAGRTVGNYRIDAVALEDAQMDYNQSWMTDKAPAGSGLFQFRTVIYTDFAAAKASVPGLMEHDVFSNPEQSLIDGSTSAPSFVASDFDGVPTLTPPKVGA